MIRSSGPCGPGHEPDQGAIAGIVIDDKDFNRMIFQVQQGFDYLADGAPSLNVGSTMDRPLACRSFPFEVDDTVL